MLQRRSREAHRSQRRCTPDVRALEATRRRSRTCCRRGPAPAAAPKAAGVAELERKFLLAGAAALALAAAGWFGYD